MTLQDFLNRSLSDVSNEMSLVDAKIHNDENGNIKSVELKYIPKDAPVTPTPPLKQFR